MGQWITALRVTHGVLFLVLGVLVLRTARDPRRRARWPIGVAVVLFGAVTFAGLARHAELGPVRVVDILLAGFLLSGWAVAEFRHRVLARRWQARALIGAGTVALVALAFVLQLPADPADAGPGDRLGTVLLLGWWCALAVDATLAFRRAARGRLPVLRKRLHLLAGAHGVLLVTVLLSLGSTAQREPVQLAARGLAIAIVPMLYLGLLPPRQLRRRWQWAESSTALAALQDLMARSVDVEAVQAAAAMWARRMLGGKAGLVVTCAGVTADGLDRDQAAAVVDELGPRDVPVIDRISRPFPALLVAVALPGPGERDQLAALLSIRGEVVGDDELELLGRLAAATGAALQHARLVRRLEQQSRQLEELIELKDALLGSMSHDLRNPLTAVSGLIDVLVNRRDELDEKQHRDLLERLANNARRMDLLLADLVDVRRTESAPLARDRHDLLEVVRDVPVCAAHPRVDVEGSATVGRFDAGLVRRAVENLVVNALDHTDGRVTVEVRSAPDAMEVVVSDRGRGIPDPLKERVFHPGVQGPDAAVGRGEGVGLFLVARIAALHHGRAWVEDRPEGGARFVLSLPAGVGPDEAPVPARSWTLSAS